MSPRAPSPRLALLAALSLALSACDGTGESTAGEAVSFDAVDSLLDAGEEAYWEGEYGTADSAWTRVLETARRRNDPVAEARALTWLGLSAWKRGDYEAARDLGERALDLKLRHDLRADLFRSHNALGLLAWHQGRLAEAVERFERAREAAEAVGDREGILKASNNLGLVQTDLGEFVAARQSYTRTLEASRALGEERITAAVLSNLASLEVTIGDPGRALRYLEEAREIQRSLDFVADEINTMGQIGNAWAAFGEPSRAIAVFDSALVGAREAGLSQEVASNLELLAHVYAQSGDYRRALAHFEEAQAVNRELGLELERATNLRNLAEIHVALGDLEHGEERAEEALTIHRAVGARHEEVVDLVVLADVHDRAGRSEAARRRLAEATTAAEAVGSRAARVAAALGKARIADRAGESRRVLSVLDRVEEDLEAGSYGGLWEAELFRARAHARDGDLVRAERAGRRSVEAVERDRRRFGSGALRTALVSSRRDAYEILIGILLEQGRPEAALAIADAARGRLLLAHLALGGAVPATSATRREALLWQIDALVEEIDAIEALPADDRTPKDVTTAMSLAERLAAARDEFARLSVTEAESERRLTLLGAAAPPVFEIRRALEPNELLLEWFVGSERTWIFAVTRDGVRAFDRAIANDAVTTRVRLARDRLSSPRARVDTAVLAGLDALLLGPVREAGILARATRLLVVPHGPLGGMPFGALVDPQGRWLVETHALLHLPSAAVLPVVRSGGGATPLVRGSVLTPFPDRLPATLSEARLVAERLDGATAIVGRPATEAALRRALGSRGIVHVATHGVLNPTNPLFSRIELVRGAGDPADDGRLEVHELLEIPVDSPLVYLSGCETGAGTSGRTAFETTEDHATLARAFLYAGAESVIATLWRVEDAGAAALAEAFYRHLRTQSPVDALAAAQRELAGGGRWSAPYHWAGYRISGRG